MLTVIITLRSMLQLILVKWSIEISESSCPRDKSSISLALTVTWGVIDSDHE